jgi:hypothetical protein
MADVLVEVRVPGRVYFECFDPVTTEFPRACPGLGTPRRTRTGRGWQFRYHVTRETAKAMLDHAETFCAAISHGVGDPSARRMVLRWVARERARLAWLLGA